MERRATLVFVVVIAALLVSGSVHAQQPDPREGPSQPVLEQNLDANGNIAVHEQGIASVDVTNESLQVTGELNVANFPPNQDVTVTNFPTSQEVSVNNFPTSQEVSVSNFPSSQEVSVSNFPGTQTVKLTPATTSFHTIFDLECCADSHTDSFDPMAVSLITIRNGSEEEGVICLEYQDVEMFCFGDTNNNIGPLVTIPLSQPVPGDAIRMSCNNESDGCIVHAWVVGSSL